MAVALACLVTLRKSLALPALALAAVSCATPGPSPQEKYELAVAEWREQCAPALRSPDLAVIDSRAWITGWVAAPSLEMLADNTYASNVEKLGIATLDKALTGPCSWVPLALRIGGEQYASLFAREQATLQEGRVALYQQKITYGEYASIMKRARTEREAGIAQFVREQQLAAQQRSADANQRSIALGLLGAQLLQGATAPMAAPSVNCQSVTSGIFTNITCR